MKETNSFRFDHLNFPILNLFQILLIAVHVVFVPRLCKLTVTLGILAYTSRVCVALSRFEFRNFKRAVPLFHHPIIISC